MKGISKSIFADTIVRYANTATIVVFFLVAGILAVLYFHLPPYVPVFNQLPWGEDRLGSTWELLIPFGVALLLYLVNLIIASSVHERVPLLARIIIITSFLVSLLLGIFMVRTMLLML